MPPEVINGKPYNESADIYSLGMVIYKLLNNKRLPFMPQYPMEFKQLDIENSFTKRIKGDKLPSPVNAGSELSKVILKACSYDVNNRYKNIKDFEEDFVKTEENESLDFEKRDSKFGNSETIGIFHKRDDLNKYKKNKKFLVIILNIVFLLVIGSIVLLFVKSTNSNSNNERIITRDRSTLNTKDDVHSYNKNNIREILESEKVSETSNVSPTITPTSTLVVTESKIENSVDTENIDNLAKNSGAENKLESWISGESYGGSAEFEASSDIKKSGNYAFKINKKNYDGMIFLYQRLNIEKNTTYKYTYYLKTNNIITEGNGGAYVYYQFYDDNGEFSGGSSDKVIGTTDWTYYETSFKMPQTVSSISIYISINNGKGIAYFDDLKLYKYK